MKRILIAHDHLPTAEACRRALQAPDRQVLAARTLDELERLCAQASPDLFVLDAALPGGDLAAFCRQARERLGRRVVLLIPPRFAPSALAALRPCVDACLHMPFTRRQLAERAQELLSAAAATPAAAYASGGTSGQDRIGERAGGVGMEIGGCRLERVLGQGATSTVYLGRHLLLDARVAVKLLPVGRHPEAEEEAQRFVRGARAAAGIQHPNVVPVLNAGCEQGFYYLVQRYIEGETLRARIEAERQLAERSVVHILQEIAAGLAAAHRLDVIHRDVKPANILLAASGAAMLTDFGLARPAGRGEISASGDIVGTPWYLAPEQCAGEAVDGRADLYALGATAYHAVAGRPPFAGDSPVAVLRGHLDLTPPDPRDFAPQLSEPFVRLVMRLLAKAPGDRHAGAEALMDSLARLP